MAAATSKWEVLKVNSAGAGKKSSIMLSGSTIAIQPSHGPGAMYDITQLKTHTVDSLSLKLVPASGKDFDVRFFSKSERKRFQKKFLEALQKSSAMKMKTLSEDFFVDPITARIRKGGYTLSRKGSAVKTKNKQYSMGGKKQRPRASSVTFGAIAGNLPRRKRSSFKRMTSEANRNSKKETKSSGKSKSKEEGTKIWSDQIGDESHEEKRRLSHIKPDADAHSILTLSRVSVGGSKTEEKVIVKSRKSKTKASGSLSTTSTIEAEKTPVQAEPVAEVQSAGATFGSLSVGVRGIRLDGDPKKMYEKVTVLVSLNDPDGKAKCKAVRLPEQEGVSPITWDSKVATFDQWGTMAVPGDYVTFYLKLKGQMFSKTHLKLGRDIKSGLPRFQWLPMTSYGATAWQDGPNIQFELDGDGGTSFGSDRSAGCCDLICGGQSREG